MIGSKLEDFRNINVIRYSNKCIFVERKTTIFRRKPHKERNILFGRWELHDRG